MAREFKNPVVRWIDVRLPIFSFIDHDLVVYPTPRNLNYWWNFGSLAGIILVIMIATGVFLAMHYTPHTEHAFNSVERIMRDVNYGWLIRYLHMNGASMFFIVVYIHMFRGMYYGSYKAPRELLWIIGVLIFLTMMATAFVGYTLPWGQMSFWGDPVITNLFSVIPIVGENIVQWLWGGFSVANPTLNRFFSLHYLLPFIIFALVFLHLWALHTNKSSNPLGIDIKGDKDTIPFHPYYTVKDPFGLGVFMLDLGFTFFSPNFFGEADNYIPADPLVTPAAIVPEWYFLPFYAMLRSVPDNFIDAWSILPVIISAKAAGVVVMFGSIILLMFLPWLDTSRVRSARFRPVFKWLFWVFVIDCIVLGYVGKQPPEGAMLTLGRVATFYYFFHLLVLLPLLGRYEKTRPLPESISAAVTAKKIEVMKRVAFAAALAAALGLAALAGGVRAAETAPTPPEQDWSFDGPFGTFDREQLQRGWTVYKQVCAACHSLHQLYYRNLIEIGFSEAEVREIAAGDTVSGGVDDFGEPVERPAQLSDRLRAPYPNPQAARAANNGALPPDPSVIVQARHGGADYIYALLTGYKEPPPGFEMQPGMNYNEYFHGHQIAMPPPLSDGIVTYEDGPEATVEQMARDVTAFLTWAAEPQMETRKRMGVKVLLFVLVLTVLLYALKRKIWAEVH